MVKELNKFTRSLEIIMKQFHIIISRIVKNSNKVIEKGPEK